MKNDYVKLSHTYIYDLEPRHQMQSHLIREFINKVISEDYGGMDMTGGDSPYGASFGSAKDLHAVFIKPFTDVVSTATGKTKELSTKAQTVARVAFETIATSLIPALSSDYEQVFAREKQELDRIKSQYKDVYDATYTSFKDNDVALMAFFFNPTAYITAKSTQQAPIQTLKLVNVITGGKLDHFIKRVAKALKFGDIKKPLDRDSGPGIGETIQYRRDKKINKTLVTDNDKQRLSSLFGDSLLREAPELSSILAHDRVKEFIENSDDVKGIKRKAQSAINNSLKDVLKRAQIIASAKTLQELQSKLNIKFDGIDKLNDVPQERRSALEQHILKSVKKSALLMYKKGIESHIKVVLNAGISKNHPFVQTHAKALSKIKEMNS